MSASESFPIAKIATVLCDVQPVRDMPPEIQGRVQEALGMTLPHYRLVDQSLIAVCLNWQKMRKNVLYSVEIIQSMRYVASAPSLTCDRVRSNSFIRLSSTWFGREITSRVPSVPGRAQFCILY